MTTYKLSELRFRAGELVRFKQDCWMSGHHKKPLIVVKVNGEMTYRLFSIERNHEVECLGHEIERI